MTWIDPKHGIFMNFSEGFSCNQVTIGDLRTFLVCFMVGVQAQLHADKCENAWLLAIDESGTVPSRSPQGRQRPVHAFFPRSSVDFMHFVCFFSPSLFFLV